MADLRDRGQIILVTGLTIAVGLVLLTLLLNTVIFTENLASRGTDTSDRDAIEFRSLTVETLGILVDEENEQRYGTHGSIEDAVTDGLETVETIATNRHGIDGEIAWVNTTSLSTINGSLIRQTNESRAFTNESGEANWSLAADIPDTRAFSMTVNKTSLVATTEGNIAADDPYHLNLTSGGTVWTVFVYENSSDNEVAIATNNGSGATEQCTAAGGNVTVDLTAGTIGGDSCEGLTWPGPISGSYDIEFEHGDAVEGTYALTVNTSGSGSVNSSMNLNDGSTTTDSPYFVPALYSANVTIVYENDVLRYVTEVRAARGEPT